MVSEIDEGARGPVPTFSYKIDLFMRSHILPRFNPERICWWLSLSGGKDSFSMAQGLRDWYAERKLEFDAVLFTINQWQGEAHNAIKRQISWQEVHVIQANAATLKATGYEVGQQAPCRACSDVRREMTDAFVLGGKQWKPQKESSKLDIVARGLHLSDTAISALWRVARGNAPFRHIVSAGKGRPISRLSERAYFAKPLFYAREFESQEYSQKAGYRHSCCGCPACKYPSRRDIVEESIAGFLRSPLWEFEVPGIRELLRHFEPADTVEEIQRRSCPGVESKHQHLPREFAREVVNGIIDRWKTVRNEVEPLLDEALDLDKVGRDRLRDLCPLIRPNKVPMPSIFRNRDIEEFADSHLMTIATLGPFWGAIGLEADIAAKVWEVQAEYFGIHLDDRWSQTTELLRGYYNKRAEPASKTGLVQIAGA